MRHCSKRLRIVLLIVFVFLTFSTQVLGVGVSKTISVRIFVDEEEPRRDELWKEVLGRRLDQASTILANYGSIRFTVTEFGTWTSDNSLNDFAASLKDFETKTDPSPAKLAIGFSSQYRLKRGVSNLGGTRGPMRSHILIREGSPKVQEIERLEVLVHELAHFLGAAHSGRADSVMRPLLGDGQSRARTFQVKLDEPNARVVNLITREMATRNIRGMDQLTLASKVGVRDQYALLAKQFPQDEVAGRYVLLMDKSIERSMAARQRHIQAIKQRAARVQAANQKTSNVAAPTSGESK